MAKLGNLRNEAPIKRVVIFLACTFRLTDQEKRETAHSLMHLLHHVDMIVLLTLYQLSLEVADPKTLLLQTTCIFQNSASFMRVI